MNIKKCFNNIRMDDKNKNSSNNLDGTNDWIMKERVDDVVDRWLDIHNYISRVYISCSITSIGGDYVPIEGTEYCSCWFNWSGGIINYCTCKRNRDAQVDEQFSNSLNSESFCSVVKRNECVSGYTNDKRMKTYVVS